MTKKILLLIALIATFSMNVSAQKVYYKCTGDAVRVRTAPSTKAKIVWNELAGEYQKLNKGDIVIGTVKKNGFIKVQSLPIGEPGWHTGWTSAKFLKPAVKCTACKGKGHTGKKCPECKGEGDEYCCSWTGFVNCPQCSGIGYK